MGMRLSACLAIAILTTAPVGAAVAQSGAEPAAAAPAPTAADDPSQQIRCRRIAVIGSLIRRERVCKTLAEWRQLQERGNDAARQQVENGRVCGGGQCSGG
jgi:predicted secreted protein